jgi:hypothetical protein
MGEPIQITYRTKNGEHLFDKIDPRSLIVLKCALVTSLAFAREKFERFQEGKYIFPSRRLADAAFFEWVRTQVVSAHVLTDELRAIAELEIPTAFESANGDTESHLRAVAQRLGRCADAMTNWELENAHISTLDDYDLVRRQLCGWLIPHIRWILQLPDEVNVLVEPDSQNGFSHSNGFMVSHVEELLDLLRDLEGFMINSPQTKLAIEHAIQTIGSFNVRGSRLPRGPLASDDIQRRFAQQI